MQSLQDLEIENTKHSPPFAIPTKTAENPVIKFIAFMPRHLAIGFSLRGKLYIRDQDTLFCYDVKAK